MKIGDRVVMTRKGVKEFPNLQSYAGVIVDVDELNVKVKRDHIVYRGEPSGLHWWDKPYWKRIRK